MKATVSKLRLGVSNVLSCGGVWLDDFADYYCAMNKETLQVGLLGISGGSVQNRVEYMFQFLPDIGRSAYRPQFKPLCKPPFKPLCRSHLNPYVDPHLNIYVYPYFNPYDEPHLNPYIDMRFPISNLLS